MFTGPQPERTGEGKGRDGVLRRELFRFGMFVKVVGQNKRGL